MSKKITIFLSCSVAIVVAALFTVTQLLAGAEPPPSNKYRAIAKSNEIEVAGVRIRYTRDDVGCVEAKEFYNDPEKCSKDPACLESLKQVWGKCMEDENCRPKLEGIEWPPKVEPGWVRAKPIDKKNWPRLWGEYLVRAGDTKGESGSGVCDEWTFTVAGSPGWHCTPMNGDIYCVCIGDYYGPPKLPDPPFNHCCDANGCVHHP